MAERITLIRHGQAGSRVLYDELSPLGKLQARGLGKWFAEHGAAFDCVVSGALQRQQATAAAIVTETGHGDLLTESGWDEFDLDAVYDGLAPHLSRDDEQFRQEHAQLLEDMADPEHAVHRAWRNCDTTLVKAWIAGSYDFSGETFQAFLARISNALERLPDAASVAVITSATPIGICCGKALDLTTRRIMSMAAALYNSSFTEFQKIGGELRLITFNNVPHLEEAVRTVR